MSGQDPIVLQRDRHLKWRWLDPLEFGLMLFCGATLAGVFVAVWAVAVVSMIGSFSRDAVRSRSMKKAYWRRVTAYCQVCSSSVFAAETKLSSSTRTGLWSLSARQREPSTTRHAFKRARHARGKKMPSQW